MKRNSRQFRFWLMDYFDRQRKRREDNTPDIPTVYPIANIANSANVTEGGNLAFIVTLDKATDSQITIPLSYSGTAVRNTDYTAPDNLVINVGQSSASVIVVTIDDSDIETDESVIVTIGSGSNYTLGNTLSGTGLILNNDVAPNPLLVAGMNNCINNGSEARAFTHCCIRWTYIVGSGDLSDVAIVMNNWRAVYGTNQVLDNQNDVNIIAASLEYNGIVAPLSFSGSRSKLMAAGESGVVTDLVPASAFGVSSIPKGATIAIKIHANNSAISMYMPTGNRHISSGGQVRWYNPANTIPSSVDAAGLWTSTGTAVDARNNGWQPIVIGRYTSTDVKVYGCFGDSITQGTGDTGGTNRSTGLGWPGLAMINSDGTTAPISFINWAVHGSATTLATGAGNPPRYFSIAKYINRATLMYATNDFGTTGTGQTLASVQANINTIISSLKTASGSQVEKIIGAHLLPRTSSTDSWLTLANQSYSGAGWQAGGNIDLYNQWLTSLVGTSLNAVVHWDFPRDATDPFKWKTNGTTTLYATTDGTHPSTVSYTGMASDIRPVIASVA